MGYQGGPQPKAGYSGTPGPAGAYQPPGGPIREEVNDISDAAPARPSALPLNKMDTVAGYDHVGFDTGNSI